MEQRLGGPIGLVVTGLVLALAIPVRVPMVDLPMLGWILAGAGTVWLVMTYSLVRQRRQPTLQRSWSRQAAVPPAPQPAAPQPAASQYPSRSSVAQTVEPQSANPQWFGRREYPARQQALYRSQDDLEHTRVVEREW